MEKEKVDFSSIEVMARLADIPIETREICDRWLLLTYDLPNTAEGNRARRKFLLDAYMMGATRHTDSVYLMPWTPDAEMLALRVASAGKACVWTSQTTNKAVAQEITQSYDKALEPMLDKIGERIDKIEWHLSALHQKTAVRMMDKTDKLLGAAERAIIRRGSAELYILMVLLQQRFATIII